MRVLDKIISEVLKELQNKGCITDDIYKCVVRCWDDIKEKLLELPILNQIIILHTIISLYYNREFITLGNYIVALYETLSKGNEDFFSIVGVLGKAMRRTQKYNTIVIFPYCFTPKIDIHYLQ